MNNSRASSRSKCSATEPASEFSIGITAAPTAPCSTRSKTSAERAHGTTDARGNILPAASWLKEPSSPWMATFMDGQSIAELALHTLWVAQWPLILHGSHISFLLISRTTIPPAVGFQWVVSRGSRDQKISGTGETSEVTRCFGHYS